MGLDEALGYAHAGLPVFPVGIGKNPLTSHGFKDATTDEATVREWWARNPDAGIATPTGAPSGIVVLDVDPRNGGDESLDRLIAEHGVLPRGPVARTGGGGEHRWFKHPGGTVPPSHGFLPGLDLQGDGAYVILPPSRHASGRPYEWVVPIGATAVPMLPAWLLKLAAEGPGGGGRRQFDATPDGRIPHGRHHDFIVQTAASLASRIAGISASDLLRSVRAAVRETIDDADAHDREVVEAVSSALAKYGRPIPPDDSARPEDSPGQRGGTTSPASGRDTGIPGSAAEPLRREAEARAEDPPVPDGLFEEVLVRGGRGATDWKPVPVRFLDWFRGSERFVVPVERGTFSTGSNFELLRYESGYYNGMARAYIRRRVEDAFRSKALASSDGFREEVVRGVASTSEFHRRREEFNPPDLLCLRNGVLDTRSGATVRAHSPETVFTWRMPVDHDPTATCPRFSRFLEEVMPDERKRELLVDLMGYCLWRENPFQLFFVLVGDGANGKTTFGRVLGALLGRDAVSTLSLQQIGSNRFASAELEGRLVNLCDDLPYDRPLAATGVLKVLTGGGSLTVERKHQHPFELVFGGKLVSMANRTPPIQDDTYAFWRRAVVIPFEQVFPKDDPRRDPLLIDKLLAELPGILNLALRGLARVRSRAEFDPDNLFSDSEEEWRRRADPIRGELLDDFEACPGAFVTNARLYEWHVNKCTSEDREPLKERAFGQYVTRAFPLSRPERKMVAGKNAWGRPGIRERMASPVLGALDIDSVLSRSARQQNPVQNGQKTPLEPATGVSRESDPSASPVLAGGFAFGRNGPEVIPRENERAPARTGDEPPPAPSVSTPGPPPPQTSSEESENPPAGPLDPEAVDEAYKIVLDVLGRRGDTPFEWERVRGWIGKEYPRAVLDAVFGRVCGEGRVRRLGDGRWQLKV